MCIRTIRKWGKGKPSCLAPKNLVDVLAVTFLQLLFKILTLHDIKRAVKNTISISSHVLCLNCKSMYLLYYVFIYYVFIYYVYNIIYYILSSYIFIYFYSMYKILITWVSMKHDELFHK